jgi:hypothetical protein
MRENENIHQAEQWLRMRSHRWGNGQGIPTSSGMGQWSASQVARFLERLG